MPKRTSEFKNYKIDETAHAGRERVYHEYHQRVSYHTYQRVILPKDYW